MMVKELIEELSKLDPNINLVKYDNAQDMGASIPMFSDKIAIEEVQITKYTDQHTIERSSYYTLKFKDFKYL